MVRISVSPDLPPSPTAACAGESTTICAAVYVCSKSCFVMSLKAINTEMRKRVLPLTANIAVANKKPTHDKISLLKLGNGW